MTNVYRAPSDTLKWEYNTRTAKEINTQSKVTWFDHNTTKTAYVTRRPARTITPYEAACAPAGQWTIVKR